MPRASAAAVEEEFTPPGQEKKRRRASGPRKEKPIYLLFTVLDGVGNAVPNAQLEIAVATKDTDTVLALQSERKDLTLAKIEVSKQQGLEE